MARNIRFTLPAALALATLILALAVPAFAQPPEDPEWDAYEQSIGADPTATVVSSEDRVAARPENVPFRRRIMREDIDVRSRPLRLDSGGKIRLIYGFPKKAKDAPAVFVLDVETNVIANSPGLRLPGASRRQKQEFRDTSYLFRSPFGSNLLGNGFVVAYIVADDLETIRSARTPDWIGILNRVRDLKQVDDNSVFLFSTREYANLSVYLTSKYTFSGFILEEPTYLLFSRNTHENIIDQAQSLSPEEIWRRTDPSRAYKYYEILSRINTPIMLIRNPDTAAYHFNEKTLIPKLYEANALFETVEIRGPARALTIFGGGARSGVMEIAPEVSYYAPTVSKWVEEMITYMRVNSAAEAVALRDPTNYRNWKK